MNDSFTTVFVNLDNELERDLMREFETIGCRPKSIRFNADLFLEVTELAPQLVLLDVGNDQENLTLCRHLAHQSGPKVILLAKAADEAGILSGFEAGAEDYVVAPFRPKEILVRAVRAVTKPDADPMSGKLRQVIFDDARSSVMVRGVDIKLTRREYKILKALADRSGRVLSRNQIIEIAFEANQDVFDRIIDTHIKNIRKKAKTVDAGYQLVKSVYGEGYVFEE